jgi:TetR/AcrR family transcriptional regulator, mexJK operon transcriptional repressor
MLDPRASGRRRTGKAGRGGRPRTADLEKLNENILAAAGQLFLAHGFDGTSMDAIAEKARISKRTLYSRHADKSALFNTVIHDLLDRILVPIDKIQYEPGDLGSVLLAIARDMVSSVMRPGFAPVYRIAIFEAQRRPEFGRWINEARRRPALQTIAGILQGHREELRISDFERAAEQLMSLTVDLGIQFATIGIKATANDMEDRLKAAIDLFLNGVRRHDRAGKEPSRRSRPVAAKK